MPQLSLYLDEAMMGEMKIGASAEGVSLSRFAANAIKDRLHTPNRIAADGHWERLYGLLANDDSFVRPDQLETHPVQPIDVL